MPCALGIFSMARCFGRNVWLNTWLNQVFCGDSVAPFSVYHRKILEMTHRLFYCSNTKVLD